MEETSSGLSLPTKNTPLEHLLPEACKVPPDTAVNHASSVPEDRATQDVRVDARLQYYLAAFERPTQPLPHAVQLLLGKLHRRRDRDLHLAEVLLHQLLVAKQYLLEDLLPPVVREDLEEVPGREGHPLGQGVHRPALLALGDLAPIIEEPQLLALLQRGLELLKLFETFSSSSRSR